MLPMMICSFSEGNVCKHTPLYKWTLAFPSFSLVPIVVGCSAKVFRGNSLSSPHLEGTYQPTQLNLVTGVISLAWLNKLIRENWNVGISCECSYVTYNSKSLSAKACWIIPASACEMKRLLSGIPVVVMYWKFPLPSLPGYMYGPLIWLECSLVYFKEISMPDFFFTLQNSFLTETGLDSGLHQSLVRHFIKVRVFYSWAFTVYKRQWV